MVLLLQDEHHLSHIEVVRIGDVEGVLPTYVALHHRHEFLYAGVECVHRCAGLNDHVAEPLDEMIDVHLECVATGIEHLRHRGVNLRADLLKAVFFILLFCHWSWIC